MTGYLARLASRAVGESATATPRLPSRFEGYAGPSPDPAPQMAGAPRRADPTAEVAPAGPPNAVAPPLSQSRPSGPAVPTGPEQPHLGPALEARGRATVARPVVPVVPPAPATKAREASEATETSESTEAAEAGLPDAPALAATHRPPAVPKPSPVVPAAPNLAVLPLDGPATAEPETVVRITIGRVEVRAAVPAPTPETKKPVQSPGPEPLALEEYLRGRRGAR